MKGEDHFGMLFSVHFLEWNKIVKHITHELLGHIEIGQPVEEAVNAGIEEIIFITSHTKIAIENHFDSNFELEEKLSKNNKHEFIPLINPEKFKNVRFTYVRQKSQRGLGDAIAQASHLINDNAFAVLLADDLIFSETSCLQQLIDIYKNTSASVIGINEVPKSDVSKYGVIEAVNEDSELKIIDIIEKPDISDAPSNLAVVGRYVLDSDIFNYLKKVEEDSSNEIQLTDAIKLMLRDKDVFGCKYIGTKFDCGSKKGFVAATLYKGLQDEQIRQEINKIIGKA